MMTPERKLNPSVKRRSEMMFSVPPDQCVRLITVTGTSTVMVTGGASQMQR